LEGGPPGFPRGSSGPVVLGVLLAESSLFRVRGSHPLRPAFPDRSPTVRISYSASLLQQAAGKPRNPKHATAATFSTCLVWAPPLSLATTRGITCCFLFLGVLRCFSSPGSPRMPMDSAYGTGPSRPVGSPIRTSTDQRSLTAPRGVSAFAPSFIGSWRPGIHRAPFLSSPVSRRFLARYPVSKVPKERALAPSKPNTQSLRPHRPHNSSHPLYSVERR
jgi:hypothetical protein